MPCTFTPKEISDTITFHGHKCPGLAIGIRAAEYALREFDHPESELVAVSETDMCGVDAIQALTGCTYGKGNFIHRDFGKMAFSFYDRRSNQGMRLLLNPAVRNGMEEEMGTIMSKQADGTATPEDLVRMEEIRGEIWDRFLAVDLEAMFDKIEVEVPAPRPARVLESLTCEHCGESAMESRTRRFAGKTLCIPCFTKVEQKI